MAGISSNALRSTNYQENRFKYNGKELQSKEFGDGVGLEWYDYKHRIYDPQIGRFLQVDSLADKFALLTPYQYASNDPIKNVDIDGLEGIISPLLFGTNQPIMRGPVIESLVEAGARVSEVGGKAAETTGRTSGTQEHHIIPRQFKGDQAVDAAREGGFKFEGAENKMPLERYSKATGEGQHGNHPNYNTEVGKRLAEFRKDNPNATPEQAADFMRNTVSDLKQTIQNNPGTKINDLFKSAAPPAPARDNTSTKPPVDRTNVQPKNPCGGDPNCI